MGLGTWARASVNVAIAALFEPPCAACRAPLTSPLDGAVCEACWSSVRASATIDEQFHAPHPLSRLISVGTYDGRMTDIIHALKYDRRRTVAQSLGAIMAERGAGVLRDADCVVPVPLHRTREFRRGFNQARDLAEHLGKPVAPLLRRIVRTPSQIDLPRHQRVKNVRDAFVLTTSPTASIIVLVDDVSTTGATLESCARVLKAAGVREVRALTAARVVNAPRR